MSGVSICGGSASVDLVLTSSFGMGGLLFHSGINSVSGFPSANVRVDMNPTSKALSESPKIQSEKRTAFLSL